jgi:multidrug resistance efflux pump
MTDAKKTVKQLESEIQSLKQALDLKEAQLKEKTEQLELAQKHLVSQKRLADIGTFISGIVHEIVNQIYFLFHDILVQFRLLSRSQVS